ncbi:MAG: 4Fe-4S dicluster domain-containing protein [Planctomycetota bacterium]|jgi:carbon-monoxide dehydrogenase iron sulfur subunit
MSKIKAEGLLFTDITRCLACHSCEMACAVAHSVSKVLEDAILEEPRPAPRVTVEGVGDACVPLQCRHCEDAPCVAICPTNALEKIGPNLPVIVRQERCIGCKFCLVVCPFGVIALSGDGKVALKCDLCVERLAEDEDPACVSACPTGALRFADVEEGIAQRRKDAARRIVTAEGQAKKITVESEDGTDEG